MLLLEADKTVSNNKKIVWGNGRSQVLQLQVLLVFFDRGSGLYTRLVNPI